MDKRELVNAIVKYLRNKYTGKVALSSRSAAEPKISLCCEPDLEISKSLSLKSAIKNCLEELDMPVRESERTDVADMVLLEQGIMILFTICEPGSALNKSKKTIIMIWAC